MTDVYNDYPLTKEQIEELLKNEKEKVDATDQGVFPLDALGLFPSKKNQSCPNCRQASAHTQVSPADQPYLYKCCSCGHTSVMCE